MTNILKKCDFWIMDISAHHDDCSHHYRKAIWNHRFVNILLRLSFLYRSLDSHNITFITLYHQAPYHKE